VTLVESAIIPAGIKLRRMTMLTKNKLAIIVAALLGVASSAMAAQAQTHTQMFADPTVADPFPTSPADNRLVGLPSDPFPNGIPGVSGYTGGRSF
jgi:hypothetical protein